jgi:hypothetical protein
MQDMKSDLSPEQLYDHPQEDALDPGKYTIYAIDSEAYQEHIMDGYGETEARIAAMYDVTWWGFVLKPDTDPHARVALAAYAESVRLLRPQLASELDQILSDFR